MEKNKNSKIIAIIALIVAVIGLSLGFAAFSRVLTIQSSAEVKTDQSVFNVKFSSDKDSLATGNITPKGTNAEVTGENAVIKDTTISNLKAHFTKPGQSVTYTFYAYNGGELDAYLKEIKFAESGKTCKPATSSENIASQDLVTKACDGIKLSISVGNGDGEISENGVISTQTVSSHKLNKKSGEKVEVVIAYGPDAQVADGDFDVTFGDITLTYKTSDE